MKIMKKAAAFVAAVSLALSLSSCGSDLSWAAKVSKDETVPIGMYIYTQAANFRTYAQSGMLTTSTALEKQTLNVSDSDKKATEYLDSEAVKSVKAYAGALILAKEMKIKQSTLSNMLNGNPTVKSLKLMAEKMHCTVAELFLDEMTEKDLEVLLELVRERDSQPKQGEQQGQNQAEKQEPALTPDVAFICPHCHEAIKLGFIK